MENIKLKFEIPKMKDPVFDLVTGMSVLMGEMTKKSNNEELDYRIDDNHKLEALKVLYKLFIVTDFNIDVDNDNETSKIENIINDGFKGIDEQVKSFLTKS